MAPLKLPLLFVAAACLALGADNAVNSYVGSKACSGCHSSIYRSFEKTDMGHSMTVAKSLSAAALPSEAVVTESGNPLTFAVSHRDTGWWQSESEPGVFSTEYPLDYVVGSGYNGLSFLIRRGRYLVQAPLSYYSKARKWDLSPGYEHTDLGFSRLVPEECINCHAGRPSPLPNVRAAYADPPFQELSIGCENCHGPGERHAKSVARLPGSIVNPAKLAPSLADNICMNCHQTGDARVTQPSRNYLDFRPGQWLFDTAIIFKQPSTDSTHPSDLLEHYSAMQASRCFRDSGQKLSCLTCHDPHVQPRKEEVAAYYRPKCFTCHTDQSCRLPLARRNAQSPADNCVGCHMPKRDVTQISHSALTNHRIPARAGELPPTLPQPVTDGLVIVNLPPHRTPQLSNLILLRAYQQLVAKSPQYQRLYGTVLDELSKLQPQDTFVQAALGDRAFAQDQTEEAITHLTQALPQGNPAIYLELAQSLAKVGRNAEAIDYLKKGIEVDPYNPVMQKTLILQDINLKSYAEARLLMQQYVANFPQDSFMRSLLARVSK